MDAFRQLKSPLHHLPDSNYYHYALQLNIYRYILESEYEMPIARMCLGVFHPLSSHPKCVVIPRMETEIGLILEFEKTSFSRSRLGPSAEMSTQLFYDKLATESALTQAQAKKFVNALTKLTVSTLKQGDPLKIPGYAMVKNHKKQALPERERQLFGQRKTIKARPASSVVRITPVKRLKDLVKA